MQKKILITGASSGLGLFLKKKYDAVKFERSKKNYKYYFKTKWDLIIHCAWDPKHYDQKNLDNYYENNILNSHLISRLNGKKIFTSSVAVYEKNYKKNRTENSFIDVSRLSTYARSKLICESFFNLNEDIILRLGSLVGENMRPCTISKILNYSNEKINLSKKSKFSFVSYEEIGNFIDLLILKKRRGIYNFLRNDYKSLGTYCKFLNNKKIKFGKIKFNVVEADNKKVRKIDIKNKLLNNNSETILLKYAKV